MHKGQKPIKEVPFLENVRILLATETIFYAVSKKLY